MNRNRWFGKLILCVVLAGLSCGVSKAASSIVLQWDANPDPAVAGYNVYYGCASGNYTNTISVGNTTSATIDGLVEGKQYYFAVTAYDAFGDESDYSAETIYVVPGWLVMMPGTNPGDPFQIHFPVAAGHWYEVQSSVDLRTWTTIGQTAGVSNQWIEYDVPVGTEGTMYYRVVSH